eukprot:scaffold139_cov199-Alexandrium_tamarense.AAC.1
MNKGTQATAHLLIKQYSPSLNSADSSEEPNEIIMAQSRAASLAIAITAIVSMLILTILSACCTTTNAYAFSQTPLTRSTSQRYAPVVNTNKRIQRRREDGSSVTLYLFPSTPSESAANLFQSRRQTINYHTPSTRRQDTKLPAMSQSVLATCDTLPGLSTAHGLLSPEVVMRIADHHDLDQDGALYRFLKTYKSRGPMACLPMLSDPMVLPELTRAMRDILA